MSATEEAVNIGQAMGHKAEDLADRSKQAGAEAVAGVARTAEALADSVASDSPAIAEYVRGAGQKIDRLATDLREKKVGDLLSSAAEVGRSQPVALLARKRSTSAVSRPATWPATLRDRPAFWPRMRARASRA
jgi:hypothetical protein